jgi:predicted RNase H-like HicB family nuclease
MKEVTYTVHVKPAEEGGFVAYFPALPGCHTQGETFDEVIEMAKDVLVGYLETLREHGDAVPQEWPRRVRDGFEFPLRVSLTQ